ncbi:hypothetical protein PIB30_063459 [Stylosanthes scabra]|uniref:Uncharacterized protein n=1 Tax=Stylosanthes scabra TaxID=79078 RepID=A0ABU6SLW4_9FABA|nr:hypothetical protein [Stylosanthes scabra]
MEIKNPEACLHYQDQLCNLSRKADSLPKESSHESPAGNEDRTTESELYRDLPAKDPPLLSSTPSLKAVEKKRTAGNNLKGSCSIMDFFNNYQNSQSSLEHKNVTNGYDVKTASSSGHPSTMDSNSTCNQIEQGAESCREEIDSNIGECSVPNMAHGRQAWDYNIDEIDHSVIGELPPEIQQEFQAWLRPHKRPNVPKSKRGSSITHYFLPDKK